MKERIYKQSNIPRSREVTYIMTSSFRLQDNFAIQYAFRHYKQVNIILLKVLIESKRHDDFIMPFIKNLQEILQKIAVQVSFYQDLSFVSSIHSDVILDKSYLKEFKNVENMIINHVHSINRNYVIIEDNVLIPTHIVTDKEEYSARTIRPKIHRLINQFMTLIDTDYISKGESKALEVLENFIDKKLPYYDQKNHPEKDYVSGLSVYIKYGLISPMRIMFMLDSVDTEHKNSFIEELIVRRELAINFIEFNDRYDQFEGITYEWAYITMDVHQFDEKEYLYTINDYTSFNTHDKYFNAAMKEMVYTGYMHGYMRMYWCKKIIEWSPSFKEAYDIAIKLNNTYFLDGNTPNGYCGVAWCFGKHDRAWTERKIFGKLRYMNDNGLKRKFDIDAYVEKIERRVKDYERI